MRRFAAVLRENSDSLIFGLFYTAAFFLAAKWIVFLLPPLLGVLVAAVTAPVCRWLQRRLHLARGKAAALTAFPACLLFLAALILLGIWLLRELPDAVSRSAFFQYEALLPEVRGAIEGALEALPQLASQLADLLPQNLPTLFPLAEAALKALLSIPTLLLAAVLIPITAYCVLKHRASIARAGVAMLGAKRIHGLRRAMHGMSKTSGGFAAAYLLIYTITFCESFIILSLLRVRYPAITALFVTISDVFPIFGPGTVLLPICVYRLLCGDFAVAAGLVIGWLLLTVIRQVIEPRLVARMTRTPPLAMLAAVYCSFVSGNFWLIPYVGLFFFLRALLLDAGILHHKKTAEHKAPPQK